MTDKNRETRFREFLTESKIDSPTIDYFIQNEKDGHPYYPMSVFMKHLWDWVRRKDQSDWIKPAIQDYYKLCELGERSGIIESLKRVELSNVDEKDVATLIHYAQIELLNYFVTMLDGGVCFERREDSWGLFEVKDIDKEVKEGKMTKEKADLYYRIYGDTLVPTRWMSGGMLDYVWKFNPDKESNA